MKAQEIKDLLVIALNQLDSICKIYNSTEDEDYVFKGFLASFELEGYYDDCQKYRQIFRLKLLGEGYMGNWNYFRKEPFVLKVDGEEMKISFNSVNYNTISGSPVFECDCILHIDYHDFKEEEKFEPILTRWEILDIR